MQSSLFSSRALGRQHWILFGFLASVSCVVTFFVNVHYGFIEVRRFGADIAQALLADPHLELGEAHLASLTELHQDVVEVSYCLEQHCTTARARAAADLPCDEGLFPVAICASETSAVNNQISVKVKVLPREVYHDACRDVIVVVLAQMFGMLAWYWLTRKSREQLRQANLSLHATAFRDQLTGLSNRAALDTALGSVIKKKLPDYWLAYIDLDDFKFVNDTRGHEVGDEVLREVARRICAGCGMEIASRMGGDEFAILFKRESQAESAIFLHQILDRLHQPYVGEHWFFPLSVSIGFAGTGCGETEASEIKRQADIALYESKGLGKARISLFDEEADRRIQAEYQMIQDFRSAILDTQVYFDYQPIVTSAGRLAGLEALARWQHPRSGAVSPEVFIPLAEKAGLTIDLGSKAIKSACRDLNFLRENGLNIDFISINVSAQQLISDHLFVSLEENLKQHRLSPSDLMLEITESLAMAHDGSGARQLHRLADAGFHIAIDDFGTGYSSLARLQALPVRRIKIDRAFVRTMQTRSGYALVETMIELSKKLGLACVAEGVETASQRGQLVDLGCEMLQGFLLGKPMPPKQLVEWAGAVHSPRLASNSCNGSGST